MQHARFTIAVPDERLRLPLTLFERRGGPPLCDEPDGGGEQIDIIVLGAGRFGGALLGPLRDAGHRVLVVDFDPRVVEAGRAEDQPALYGDAEDPELPAALPLEGVRWVVSTVRRREVSLALLHALEHHSYTGGVALSAHRAEDAEDLRDRGAHDVLRPYEAAAADAVASLTATFGITVESPTPPVRTPPAEIVERSGM